jgi:predicted nucleic acid-binding protein
VILCDTGPLVEAALRNDDDYHACAELFTGLDLAGRQILVPGPVVAEAGYLIARQAGARVEALFLTSLQRHLHPGQTYSQATSPGWPNWS